MRYTRERVELETRDGVKLVGSFHDGGSHGIILLHQYGLDHHSYDEFARQLQEAGFSAIAIDLRGHGESQGALAAFTEKDFQAMLNDAEAAATLLQRREKRVVGIVGASIGANTALRYSGNRNEPAVLLSPGLNYHGIDIDNVTSRAPVLMIAAEDDAYSVQSSRELDENNLFGIHDLLIMPGGEHGTSLLPQVADHVLAFLVAHRERS